MIKLIACDVDETLLDDQHLCPVENIEMIQKARELGVKFVLASGRGFSIMQKQLDMIGLKDMEDEYTISFNGGVLTENKGNVILSKDPLGYEKANKIFEFAMNHDLCVHIYTTDSIYAFNMDDEEYKHLTNMGIPIKREYENSILFLKDELIIKVLFFSDDLDYLKGYEEQIIPLLEGIELTYSSNRFMEFNLKGIHKGYGVCKLAKMLNIDLSEVMVIGDNDNDISMMKVAGLSIAAGNARKEIQDVCDYTTKASNNEGVVAEAIRKFILNEEV